MSDASGLFAEITRRVASGETLAVATIVDTRGSTPREVGAKMLIRPDGGIVGTIGGGCGEADVWRAALDVIDTKLPMVVQVDLTEDMNLRTEAVCGGIMQIFVEPRYPVGADAEPGAPP
ncbi:MAG TPA: XdhC family protein, partial [Chloroflexota bacterium]